MKGKTTAILSALVMLLALSCAKNNEGLAFLHGEERSFACDYSRQTLSIEFEASDNWYASIEYSKESTDNWASIAPRNGYAGKNELTVSVEENTNPYYRDCKIRILCHNKSLEYSISQSSKSNSDEEKPSDPIDPTIPDNPFNPDSPKEEIDSRKFIKSIEITCLDKYSTLISKQSQQFSYDESWRITNMSTSENHFSLQYYDDHILYNIGDKNLECQLFDEKLVSFQKLKFKYDAEKLKSICDIPIIWSAGNAFTANSDNKITDIKYSRDFLQTGNIHLTIMCIYSIIDMENAIKSLPMLQYGLLGERSANAIESATVNGKKYLFNYLLDNYDRIIRIDEFSYDTAGNNYLSKQYRIEYMH